ncbi:hypothetical protein [Roseomonas indoligenes]|uniref:Uncharacterized protein n=1 Tax=Roseomonas indoligenes TaxID=2820811 RepID=A0A940MXA4_9PROT|nr:hypothetical protein [Pararoseomonas indoligenes]MBP0492519.1 hypothetical protein [Pararoseomonas indoligenes]
MTSSDPGPLYDWREELDALLEELVGRFNERDLERVLLRDVGLALIQRLAAREEVDAVAAEWRERWRETVRLEKLPMHRPN